MLCTTAYLDAAVRQLRAQGYPLLEEDMARPSPFVRWHLGVHGTYGFVLPDHIAASPMGNRVKAGGLPISKTLLLCRF